MSPHHFESYLYEKLGPEIRQALEDDDIHEIMLNPDGKLWFKTKLGNRLRGFLSEPDANAFVNALSQFDEQFINQATPFLDVVLPFSGERVNATIPPISRQVSFNIRKHAKEVYSLKDYVAKGIMTEAQAHVLRQGVLNHDNILVSGSPASGKTTLTNAILQEIAHVAPEGYRLVVLEQVPELRCVVPNTKTMMTTNSVTMRQLLWIAMRSSPDAIVVGEVRDGAALDLLKAWNTGCKGGVATVHANHPEAAIQRLIDLSCEVSANPPYRLAAEALDLIVQIEANANHPAKRQVTSIQKVQSFDPIHNQFNLEVLA